jgi:hypothetical protein
MSYHLFTPPDFGLGNRLRGYVAAWAYAKKMKCILHVLWKEMPSCPYRIEELFEPLPNSQFITDDICSNTTYVYTSTECWHLSQLLNRYEITPALSSTLIASLVPVISIREKLEALYTSINCKEAIGLHIRRTDHVEYANSVGGHTQLDVFWKRADSYPNVPIFLACDDVNTLVLCKKRYGNRVHISKDFSESPLSSLRNTDGEHAVLDIYCLALCRYFQGSHASSFSAHVEYLRNAWATSSSLQKKVIDIRKIMKEKVVFAFSLFGNKKKYTEGMIANASSITKRFPDARVQVYIANDVPLDIVDRLSQYPTVRLIRVEKKLGTLNTIDRFLAIDDDDCDVLFSRDTDSRVHERDASCIEDFLSSDKLLHIIRDHRCHRELILAGAWGIRKRALSVKMGSIIQVWANKNTMSSYGCDQKFLADMIYPNLVAYSFIQDRIGHFRHMESNIQPFRKPIVDKLYVGQVHDYNEAGEEILECGID